MRSNSCSFGKTTIFYSNTVGDISENFLNLNAREVIMEAF
jgi:hypothetical protein